MSKGNKIIEVAGGVLLLVILLGIGFGLAKKGQDTYSSANAEMTNSLSAMATSQYDSYNGTSETGEGVRRTISELFNNEDIEVLVSCKDGSNYVYNSINLGKSTATVIALDALTGMPTYDAAGNAFAKADVGATGKAAAISGAPATLMCSTGYNTNASVSTIGYVSATATFECSVQKDINGNVRRLTYIQK